MKAMKRLTAVLLALVLFAGLLPAVPRADAAAYSSSRVYHKIDMSAAVLASRTNQQVSSDCAVVSMVTVESYLYGATSAADKKTVYNTLVNKNGDDNYAYWGNCGYVSNGSVNWTTVYDNLSRGYPVLVHRPSSGSKVEHWAVVAGYNGSTTTLEKDKFIIVDVYHGSGGKDIYTSGAWRGSVSIDRMVTRKNGIAITSLSGIKMAINHPAPTHQYGNGHGVYGYVTSNVNLTSLQVKVTNDATGAAVYNKTLTPNAKSYQLYKLDSEMTFAKWAKGKYTYTVIAKTASATRTYQYSFEIATGWPTTQTQKGYVFTFIANGGTGAPASQTVYADGTLKIPATTPTRQGYKFLGWYAQRNGDQTWYVAGSGWKTDAEIAAAGYSKKLYPAATDFVINNSWLNGCADTTGFTLYAQWEKTVSFPDVSTNAWYYNAVVFAVENGYFSGYKNGNFGPNDEITRQDFVVVLARIAGVDLSKYSGRTVFKDVPAGSYYESAIKWASSTGVVSGYNSGNFGVDDKLTREQLVTILYRIAKKLGCDVSVSLMDKAKLAQFQDVDEISSYAIESLAWALDKGVISGLNKTTLAPQRTATRAQVAQILMNIYNNNVIPF